MVVCDIYTCYAVFGCTDETRFCTRSPKSVLCLYFYSIMMLWNKEYQKYDLVVSSVTTKVKGVAEISIPDIGKVVWDVVDYSGPSQVTLPAFIIIFHTTKNKLVLKHI